ncbi:MAG: type VI secretion system baseplate subunit TssE [Pyrinomonadaceae bacterium]
MAREDSQIRVTSSVLDRLIDFEPRELHESPKTRTTSIKELKQSVLRDLDWLLNTRHGFTVPEDLKEAVKSVICYGLPDFTALSVKSQVELNKLIKDIENSIRFFEPRFIDLKISFEPVGDLDRQIRFRIDASLDVDPAPEPITFDTVLNSGSGAFSVIQK